MLSNMFSSIIILCLAPTVSGARRMHNVAHLESRTSETMQIDASSQSQSSYQTPGQLLVRTFQWNSDKADLSEETVQLFGARQPADLVAVCMTEAVPSKGIHEILADSHFKDDWVHIAYGRHTGVAGGEKNAQILSVFLRQNANGFKYEVNPPASISWIKGMDWSVAGMMKDELMTEAQIPGVVDARTLLHQTSTTGKGGVSAMLEFSESANLHKTNLGILCAHLDSEDRDDRRNSVKQMMEELATGQNGQGEGAADIVPCTVWDSDKEGCERSRPARQKMDAVMLMGDLNFRVQYLKDDGSTAPFPKDLNAPVDGETPMEELISTQAGRDAMFKVDPLNSKGIVPELIVRDAPDGFGFECNDPHRNLPSYKRSKLPECSILASKLLDCGEMGEHKWLEEDRMRPWRDVTRRWQEAAGIHRTPGCSKSEIDQLTADCFKAKKTNEWKLKKEKKQEVKKRNVQLGWLDRLCYRAVDGPVKFNILQEYPWAEHPYGDHAPVEILVSVDHAKGQCTLPPVPRFTQQKPVMINADHKVPEFTELHYTCKAGCFQIGGTRISSNFASIQCKTDSTWDSPPPQCHCGATLKIQETRLEGIDDVAKVDKIKIKLFPRSLTGRIDENPKGYTAVTKAKIHGGFPADISPDKFQLDNQFLHLELCDTSATNWIGKGSSCDSYGRTIEPAPATPHDDHVDEMASVEEAPCELCFVPLAEKFFKEHPNGEGSVTIDVPLQGKRAENGVVKMTYSIELEA